MLDDGEHGDKEAIIDTCDRGGSTIALTGSGQLNQHGIVAEDAPTTDQLTPEARLEAAPPSLQSLSSLASTFPPVFRYTITDSAPPHNRPARAQQTPTPRLKLLRHADGIAQGSPIRPGCMPFPLGTSRLA